MKNLKKLGKEKGLVVSIISSIVFLGGSICLGINIALDNAISWSLYPIGALCIFELPMLVAVYCKTNKLEYTSLTLVITIIGYLTMIEYLTNTNDWLLQIGIPITVVGCVSLYSIIKACLFVKNQYYAVAICFLVLAIGPFFGISAILYVYEGIQANYYASIAGIPTCLTIAFVLFTMGRVRKIV